MSLGTDLYAFFTGLLHKSKPNKGCMGFYGRANYWHGSRKILCKELNKMADANLTGYLIELAGMGSQYWNDKGVKYIDEEYKWLLKQARRRNLAVFVSIVNDNLGRDGGKRIGDYGGIADRFSAVAFHGGSKLVYIQPVAETQTAYGKKFDSACGDMFHNAGFTLVYNGEGGRPSKVPFPFNYRAMHYAKSSVKPPAGAWSVSDHSLLIKELNGGPIDGHGVPDKVENWVKGQKAAGAAAVGYYAYKVKDYDPNTIEAIGKGLK